MKSVGHMVNTLLVLPITIITVIVAVHKPSFSFLPLARMGVGGIHRGPGTTYVTADLK